MGWFSAKSCINEAIVTEGLIALMSNTVEGRMLQQQVARLNAEQGTVYSPWRHPVLGRSVLEPRTFFSPLFPRTTAEEAQSHNASSAQVQSVAQL